MGSGGLRNYDRTPGEDVRARRNAQRMSGQFTAYLGDGLLMDGGLIVVDHDDTQNFVADEHIDHTTVNIDTGHGLSGGGDISSTRTLIVVDTEIDHDVLIVADTDVHINWTNGSEDGINYALESSFVNVNTAATAFQIKDVTYLATDLVTSYNIFVGRDTGGSMTTGANNTIVGCYSGSGLTEGIHNTIVGANAGTVLTTGKYNTIVGSGADVDSATRESVILLGHNCVPTADHQCLIGSGHTERYINDIYLGGGVTSDPVRDVTLNATGGSGFDRVGANFSIAAGKGTGVGAPGTILFNIAAKLGGTSDGLQSLVPRMSITHVGINMSLPMYAFSTSWFYAPITTYSTVTISGVVITGSGGYLKWGDLKIGGSARITADGTGSDDNLMLNGKGAGAIYTNYDSGTGGMIFCDGSNVTVATLDATGFLTCTKLHVGDAATNYAQFDTDGELTLAGTARVKKAIDMAGSTYEKGGTAPAAKVVGNYLVWEYDIGDDSVLTFELPHDWASGTDVSILIDWSIDNAVADREIQWNVSWTATNHDGAEALDHASTTLDPGDIVCPTTPHALQRNSMGAIAGGSLAIEDEIGLKIERVAIDDGTGPATKPYITHLYIEYTADKLGEAT